MRRGHMHKGVLEQDGVFYGFSLGADFTAEHEHGIDKIYGDFGIEPKLELRRSPLGIENTRIKEFPKKKLMLITVRERINLILEDEWFWGNRPDNIPRGLEGKDDIEGAWDDNSFGLSVNTKKHGEQIKELWDALKKKDVAITFMGSGRGNPFDRCGLAFVIVSKFPKDANEELIKSQNEYFHLFDSAKASGLEKYLEEKGKGKFKGYYSIRPKFNKSGELEWYLQPCDYQNEESGWYSTQQIKDWADNKPKNAILKASAAA